MFRRRREAEPQANVTYSVSSKELINTLPLENMLRVADSIPYLEHLRFREEHKTNINLRIDSIDIWAMMKGTVWMAYRTETDGNVYLEWVSIISKFRR